jgi:hypothetical protein
VKCGFDARLVLPAAGMTTRKVNRVIFDATIPELKGIRIDEHARDAALMACHWGKQADFDKATSGGKG